MGWLSDLNAPAQRGALLISRANTFFGFSKGVVPVDAMYDPATGRLKVTVNRRAGPPVVVSFNRCRQLEGCNGYSIAGEIKSADEMVPDLRSTITALRC